jgi:hypothetical protein
LSWASHVDSLIQVGLGVIFTWLGYRGGAGRLDPRARMAFRICGPALIVIGVLLAARPQAAARWETFATADQVARADFPGKAAAQESTDTLGAITVKRTSFTLQVPGKDLSLFLSDSALPAEAAGLGDAQLLESTLAYFTAQGFVVSPREKDASGRIHRMTMRQAAKKTTVRLAIAYAGGRVYRALASYADGSEDEALVSRFVASFRLSTPP